MPVMYEEIAEQIAQGDLQEATKALEGVTPDDNSRAEFHYLQGLLHEREFDDQQAVNAYTQALAANEDYTPALFRSALLADRHGEDDAALDFYERCLDQEQVPLNVLLNLAMIYEERARYDQAAACAEAVLSVDPNHVRALYLRRSIDSSRTMVIDERSARDRDKRSAALDVPISDFELSVRSRNCLKQMNIRTLGDLLRTTEDQLLAYKNFGETSLNEIKAMLKNKGLRLGQGIAESRPPGQPAPIGAPPEPSMHGLGGGGMPSTIGHTGILSKPVSDLELSVRSRKCLQRLGVTTIGELASCTEAQLMSAKNFGLTSLTEIKRQLAQHGLTLRGPR